MFYITVKDLLVVSWATNIQNYDIGVLKVVATAIPNGELKLFLCQDLATSLSWSCDAWLLLEAQPSTCKFVWWNNWVEKDSEITRAFEEMQERVKAPKEAERAHNNKIMKKKAK